MGSKIEAEEGAVPVAQGFLKWLVWIRNVPLTEEGTDSFLEEFNIFFVSLELL